MVGTMVHEQSFGSFFIKSSTNMSLNLLGNSCYEVSIVPPQTSLKVKENFNFVTFN